MPPSDSAVRTFAILYVLGNIITLCATGFLLTPKSQWSKMWDPTRRYTTAFYLTMLVVVFAVAITVHTNRLIGRQTCFLGCEYDYIPFKCSLCCTSFLLFFVCALWSRILHTDLEVFAVFDKMCCVCCSCSCYVSLCFVLL